MISTWKNDFIFIPLGGRSHPIPIQPQPRCYIHPRSFFFKAAMCVACVKVLWKWAVCVGSARLIKKVFPLRLEGRLLYWKPRPHFQNLLRKHCMQLYITDMRCRNCWLKYSQIERKPNVVMELGHRPRQMFQLGDPAFGCLRGRESPWMTILFFQQAGLLCRRNFLAESRLQLTLG